ncbi:hypothetical protein J6590_017349 [Homalodisca vitripennis]|nr:hypothetical protein J6590_017349 [Homalodisca vitripennis]
MNLRSAYFCQIRESVPNTLYTKPLPDIAYCFLSFIVAIYCRSRLFLSTLAADLMPRRFLLLYKFGVWISAYNGVIALNAR